MGNCLVYGGSSDGTWEGCSGHESVDKVHCHGDSWVYAHLDGVHAGLCDGRPYAWLLNGVSRYSPEAHHVPGFLGYDYCPPSFVLKQRFRLEIVSCLDITMLAYGWCVDIEK